jgi:hypothetical protein
MEHPTIWMTIPMVMVLATLMKAAVILMETAHRILKTMMSMVTALPMHLMTSPLRTPASVRYQAATQCACLAAPRLSHPPAQVDEDAFDPDASFPDTTEYVPYGRAVSFRFAGCAIGETITVSVDFGETLPAGSQIHKVDEATWSAPLVDVTLEGRVFSYTLTDGGDRDADGVANGVIVDPVTASLPRGNGGPTAIPTVPAMLLWLMSVLVAFAGAVRLRR